MLWQAIMVVCPSAHGHCCIQKIATIYVPKGVDISNPDTGSHSSHHREQIHHRIDRMGAIFV
jgi:hypothetical protein